MIRIRAFALLLTLFVLSGTTHRVQASVMAPEAEWKLGKYLGAIFMYAHEYVAAQPSAEDDFLHEEHRLDILVSTGKLRIIVTGLGLGTHFEIPIRYTYMDWSQIKHRMTGVCEGLRSEASGHGTLVGSSAARSASGTPFTVTPRGFHIEGFTYRPELFGENCVKVDGQQMRLTMDIGFKDLFKSDMTFTVMTTLGNFVAGTCEIPGGYQLEGDHSFNCTWYVQLVTKHR